MNNSVKVICIRFIKNNWESLTFAEKVILSLKTLDGGHFEDPFSSVVEEKMTNEKFKKLVSIKDRESFDSEKAKSLDELSPKLGAYYRFKLEMDRFIPNEERVMKFLTQLGVESTDIKCPY